MSACPARLTTFRFLDARVMSARLMAATTFYRHPEDNAISLQSEQALL
jgi:hypothetical protein